MTSSLLTLANWRREISELYAYVRQVAVHDPARAAAVFRAQRDHIFKHHVDSPIEAQMRTDYPGVSYFDYDPAWRVMGTVEQIRNAQPRSVNLAGDGVMRYLPVGKIHFTVANQDAVLTLFWIEGYGGGLWLPFKDATSNVSTYGGGRYLYDSIKGADLGVSGDQITLDFNFAYNPSCSYSPRYVCPLSPEENVLAFEVPVGEKHNPDTMEQAVKLVQVALN